MYKCLSVHILWVYMYMGVHVYGVHVYGVHVYGCTYIWAYMYMGVHYVESTVQVYTYIDVQVHKYTSIWVFKCIGIQGCTTVQVYKYISGSFL